MDSGQSVPAKRKVGNFFKEKDNKYDKTQQQNKKYLESHYFE